MSSSSPAASSPLLLAWIGLAPAPALSGAWQLRQHEDSDDFLLSPAPYDCAAYVVQLAQRGVGGLDLLRLLRRRLQVPLLALDASGGEQLVLALDAGADMVLPQNCPPAHLEAGLRALLRRSPAAVKGAAAVPRSEAWRLHLGQSRLQTPQGQSIELSEGDLQLLRCLAQAGERRASHEQLCQALWGREPGLQPDNALHATLYRLRRRVELASGQLLPIRSQARRGYEFRAPLELVED